VGQKGPGRNRGTLQKDITLIAALHGERKSLSATDIEIVTAAREKKDVDAFDTNIKRTHRKIAVLLADESRLSGQIETHLQKQYKKIDDDEGLAIEEVRRTLGKEYDDLLDEYATDPVPLEDEKKKRELKQEELLAKAKKEDNLGTTATVKPGGGTLEL